MWVDVNYFHALQEVLIIKFLTIHASDLRQTREKPRSDPARPNKSVPCMAIYFHATVNYLQSCLIANILNRNIINSQSKNLLSASRYCENSGLDRHGSSSSRRKVWRDEGLVTFETFIYLPKNWRENLLLSSRKLASVGRIRLYKFPKTVFLYFPRIFSRLYSPFA